MDRNELWRLIQHREKECERNKLVRFIKTYLLYAAAFCALHYLQGGFSNYYTPALIGEIVVCFVVAGIFVFFSTIIFWQLFEKSEGEKRALERLRLELAQLEREAEQQHR